MTKVISNLPSEYTRKAILIKECRYIPAAVSCMRLKELKKVLATIVKIIFKNFLTMYVFIVIGGEAANYTIL